MFFFKIKLQKGGESCANFSMFEGPFRQAGMGEGWQAAVSH
jgi:hypothetical protein